MRCQYENSRFQKNYVELMPIYNRTYGHSILSSDGDIALSTHNKIIYLEKEIKSDDTLQSIALEFNVPVSELKRINNIHKENEIYARKVIKVPSKPWSLLLEKEYFSKVPLPQEDKTSAPTTQTNFDDIVETINNCNCNPRNCDESNSEEITEELLLYKSNKITETREESVSLLCTAIDHKPNDVISCNGADWGMSWHVLILFTLLLGVGGPVIYVFWFLWGKSHKTEGS